MKTLLPYIFLGVYLFLGCDEPTVAPPVTNPPPASPATIRTPPGVVRSSSAFECRILGWNVESDGSDPEIIFKQLEELKDRFDIVCLSEVPRESMARLAKVFPDCEAIYGSTGNNDRLCISYDPTRFELLRAEELKSFRNVDLAKPGQRSPLIGLFQERTSQKRFYVINNHLARGNAEYRTLQAKTLVEWAREQALPVIAVGDYNMDYDFHTGRGNDAFAAMLGDGIFKWVKPAELIDSNWADRDKDGVDDYPDSLLDFVFVSGPAKEWKVEAEVIVRAGDFPDDATTSDHRPVLTTVNFE